MPSHKDMERNQSVFGIIFGCIFQKDQSIGSYSHMFLFAGFLSFGRDVKLGVPCQDAACIVGLN